jgi:hypothetical protein
VSLGIQLPGLAKSLTPSLESCLINLAIAFDDVDLTSSTVGERSDLPCALIPAHCSDVTVKSLDKDDDLVRDHGKASVSALPSSALHPCSKMADPLFVE